MGKIFIDHLKVFAHHGVMKEENENGQDFYVSVEINSDFSGAAKDDDLNKTINYNEVANDVISFMTENTFKLIETCAERLCLNLIAKYELADEVKVTIHKPQAPLVSEKEYGGYAKNQGLSFADVSVSSERKRVRTALSVGSNMGDSEGNINGAIGMISKSDYCKVVKVSKLIVTKPYGFEDQDDFVNGALVVDTVLKPYEYLDFLGSIEQEYKRERKVHWGPRTLDLDIVFYGDLVMSDSRLTIPHVDMQNRQFVLEPLTEIMPYKRHPIFGLSVKEMFDNLEK